MYRIQQGEAYSGCIPITLWFVQMNKETMFSNKWINIKGFDRRANADMVIENLKMELDNE